MTCRRCHRTLTAPASRLAGIGPVCARRERAEAAAAGAHDHQINAAVELIEMGAIVYGVDGVYYSVSSDGSEVYTSTHETCSCPAFERGRFCYHRAAVAMVNA